MTDGVALIQGCQVKGYGMIRRLWVLGWMVALVLLAACQPDAQTTPAQTPAVDDATAQDAQTSDDAQNDAEEAPEADSEAVIVEPAETPEPEDPSATPEPDIFYSNNVSPDGHIILAARGYTDLIEEMPADTPAAPNGTRWVYVEVTILHSGDYEITVEPGSLYVTDVAGNRYPVAAPDAATFAPIVGSTFEGETTVRGFARFAVATSAEVADLGWCLDEACEVDLSVPLP